MNDTTATALDLDIEADAPLSPDDTREAERLLALAEELGLENSDLFGIVHDAASRYASDACNAQDLADGPLGEALHDEAGRQAAQINNNGLEHQIRYLVAQFGTGGTELVIRGGFD